MTNWSLIGPAPFTSFRNEKADLSNSIGYLTVNKQTDGGNWVQYSASWPETTNRLRLLIKDPGGSGRQGSISVGIGGSGSERAILEIPGTAWNDNDSVYILPITIRGGERVSIKPETAGSSVDVFVVLTGWFDPLFRTDLRYADLIGVVSATALTVPDPGGTIHTKGAWSQLIASTANDYKSIVLFFSGTADANSTTVDHLFDLAVGASSSEVIIVPDVWVRRIGRSPMRETKFWPIDANIPSGTRIAARCQADNITSGVRDLQGIAVIGLR